ncbi:odorant receptor Or1-like [Aphidius gifuensis]|uniref:odorant receptor Or1-like n=1 Tax=Aphidius gifuensis TaxID=684658 RepID=UPI001CDBB26F|nr:odorant receptor Or1-like [Aphidius gifuensis]
MTLSNENKSIDTFTIENNSLKHLKPNLQLNISLKIIKYLGTWPPVSSWRNIYYIFTLFSFIFILGIYLVVQLINIFVFWGNIEVMVASTFLLMTNSVHAYKICVIIKNQKRIQLLFDTISSELFTKNFDKYERIFTWYAWSGIKHHIAYQSFGTMAVFCWGFVPISNAITGNERQLPMDGWYPYDTKLSPAFELTCGHQAVAVIIACCHNIGMDTLINGFINVACCQLEVIKQNILSIDDGDKNVHQEINQSVQHSVVVMKFIDEVQSIFGTVIMYQLIANCLIICLTAFHVVQMTVYIPAEIFGMMMYMCCMTYQIFIFCWNGNELTIQSETLAFTAITSNWWKFDKKYKRSLGILITRSHKPMIFKAGPLINLSLQTFMKVLRMSYSFFTLLQSSTNPH